MTVRIGLVHAIGDSIPPVEAAFAELWPEAEPINLYDQSLYPDYNRAGGLTPALRARVAALLRHSESCGARAIVCTGSLFGGVAVETGKTMSVPVLGAYDGMIEAAFDTGARFGALATSAIMLDLLHTDIDLVARARGIEYSFEGRHVAGAFDAVAAGDQDTHDRLIAQAAAGMADCDVLMLGQFSMAAARHQIADLPGRTVLSSPHCTVRKLRQLLAG